MKRKYGDRPNWKRVLSRNIVMEKFDNDTFRGYAILTQINKVKEALWVELAGKLQCVADDGYSWLTLFPKDQYYVVTAMFDSEDKVVQWYIDICRNQGFTDKGMPWYDDLYLDIIISADRKISLIDEDDLALALKQNVIKREDYDFAYQEANKLLELLKKDKFALLEFTREIHGVMKNKLNNKAQRMV